MIEPQNESVVMKKFSETLNLLAGKGNA